MKKNLAIFATLLLTSGAFCQLINPSETNHCDTIADTAQSALSVMLSSFKATQQGNAVVVTWETKAEINHAGFNLHRRREKDLSYIRINPHLISEGQKTAEGTLYEFVDTPPKPGLYMYQLEDVNLEGFSNYSPIISIEVTEFITKVDAKKENVNSFRINPNYPNPFNALTTLSFELARDEMVRISIVDADGRLVEELYSGELSAGRNEITWNAESAATGLYYALVQTPTCRAVQKMTLVK
ncbi:MAG: T9SS type A sorting domain-containing protein [candidate division KSB1 bacterium]|nr:T9SS type A sorting domain-containing protein [candidate division KSB1 bacterium]MDZ7345309.1 T9SS type A sorting domain-containing protein [candidate division KSB1 bacterium]